MIDCLTSELHGTQASRTCPTVAATPAAVKAAFTKEGDLFKEKGILFLDTFVNLSQPDLFERQMYEQFQDLLGLTPEENARAVAEGYRALDYFNNVTMRAAARETLEQLEREDRLGVVLLGRPYHMRPVPASALYCKIAILWRLAMAWTVETLNAVVDAELERLPVEMRARFAHIAGLIEEAGLERVREPHVKHLRGRLWEMRMKGRTGISRALYVTATGQRVVVVRAFIKKTQRTPDREIELALKRAREVSQ